jgi:hypothetical protein
MRASARSRFFIVTLDCRQIIGIILILANAFSAGTC